MSGKTDGGRPAPSNREDGALARGREPTPLCHDAHPCGHWDNGELRELFLGAKAYGVSPSGTPATCYSALWIWWPSPSNRALAKSPRRLTAGAARPRAAPVCAMRDHAMDQKTTALERAFQLAKSGDFATLEAIRSQLKAEGYPVAQIVGKTLLRQLRDAARVAKGDLSGAANSGTT